MATDFTEETAADAVIESFGAETDPRLREILSSLVRHLHGFAREVELTIPEWEKAIDFLTRTGHMCTDERQEFILLSDVLGLSMLTETISNRKFGVATESTVLGPFHVVESPVRALGDTIDLVGAGTPCVVTGRVVSVTADSIGLAVLHRGSIYVRVRWSPYWQLHGVRGCVAAAGQFTRVEADTAGRARLTMSFSLTRAGSRAPRCDAGGRPEDGDRP